MCVDYDAFNYDLKLFLENPFVRLFIQRAECLLYLHEANNVALQK